MLQEAVLLYFVINLVCLIYEKVIEIPMENETMASDEDRKVFKDIDKCPNGELIDQAKVYVDQLADDENGNNMKRELLKIIALCDGKISKLSKIRKSSRPAEEQSIIGQAVQENREIEINVMKKTLEKAQNAITKREKEIEKLNEEHEKLSSLIECGVDWTPCQLQERNELTRKIDESLLLLEETKESVRLARALNYEIEETVKSKKKERDQVVSEHEKLHHQRNDQQEKVNSEVTKKGQLSIELNQLCIFVEQTSEMSSHLSQGLSNENINKVRLEGEIESFKQQMDTNIDNYSDLLKQMQKSNANLLTLKEMNQKLSDENELEKKNLILKKQTLRSVKKESGKAHKQLGILTSAMSKLGDEQNLIQKQYEDLKTKNEQMEKVDLKAVQKIHDSQRRQLKDLKREIDVTKSKSLTSDRNSTRANNLVLEQEQSLRNFNLEEIQIEKYIAHQESSLQLILSELESLNIEKRESKRRVDNTSKQLRDLEEMSRSCEDEIKELEKSLIIREEACSSIRDENKKLLFDLVSLQNEVTEEKVKFSDIDRQCQRLQQDIVQTDQLVLKEHYWNFHAANECASMKDEIIKLKEEISCCCEFIDKHDHEYQRLTKILREADEEESRQRTKIKSLANEIIVLQSKASLQDTERSKLQSILVGHKTELHQCEVQYEKCINSIIEASESFEKLLVMIRKAENQFKMREEKKILLTSLQQELTHWKVKNHAMENELEHPMNIHRLRRDEQRRSLEDVEMHNRINLLRKKLISLSDELYEKTRMRHEKQRYFDELCRNVNTIDGFTFSLDEVLDDDDKILNDISSVLSKELLSNQALLNEKQELMQRVKDDLSRSQYEVNHLKEKLKHFENEHKKYDPVSLLSIKQKLLK